MIGEGRSLAVTSRDACFLDAASTVRCRPIKVDEDRNVDATPIGSTRAIEIVAGDAHACARTDGGEVHCWGANAWSQLARDAALRRSPKAVPVALKGCARTLFAFYRSTCALLDDGAIMCWGAQDDPGALVGSRVCDERLIAPDVWCADAPAPVSLPTTFIPHRRRTGGQR